MTPLSTTNGRVFGSERQQVCNINNSETMIILDYLAERPFNE